MSGRAKNGKIDHQKESERSALYIWEKRRLTVDNLTESLLPT
jgi:hypothetical protein